MAGYLLDANRVIFPRNRSVRYKEGRRASRCSSLPMWSDARTVVLFSLMLVRKSWGLEYETLRVDQIVACVLLGQAVDSSAHFSQTSNRCDAGEVTVWKPFEDIKSRIHLEPRGKRMCSCL